MSEEVFEIHDFSTASDWERFIADLEEILRQWNLGGESKDFSGEDDTPNREPIAAKLPTAPSASSKLFSDPRLWTQKQDQIRFGKVSFSLTCMMFENAKSKEVTTPVEESTKKAASKASLASVSNCRAWRDMNSIDHDWPASGHPLVRYYGFSQFLVLSPLNTEVIDTEDRIRHVLGSAVIALNNTNCEVPFFCQISQLSRRLFSGVLCINNGFRTYFDMIQFPDVPPSFTYMSDLITLFKKKLHPVFSYSSVHRNKAVDKSDDRARIRISIRFTYLLSVWPPQYLLFNGSAPSHPALEQFVYFRTDFKPCELLLHPIGIRNVAKLYADPLKQLQLATTWPSIAEELITDNEYHSDLHPRSAPRWSLRALFLEQSSKQSAKLCHTTEWLRAFIALRYQYKTKSLQSCGQQQLNDDADASEMNVRSALDRLSSPSNQLSNQLFNVQKNVLGQLEKNFFAIAGSKLTNVEDTMKFVFEQIEEPTKEEDSKCAQLKSSSLGSLSWRIAILLANTFAEQHDIATVSVIWNAFVEKLRSHWQSSTLLPFVDAQLLDSIDYGHCLLHQKLQMLNCCIRQKTKREGQQGCVNTSLKESLAKLQLNDQDDGNEEDDGEDDEFFDAPEDEPNLPTVDGSKSAEDQLEPLTNSSDQVVCLLDKPGTAIYVPVTQDPAPMTEDAHFRQMQTLASMNNSPEDSKLKIRLQSAGLLSDMEAFKAANSGARFEDFIRWHSPRDWVELDDEDLPLTSPKRTSSSIKEPRFGLSRRMRESTLWAEIWELARPVPVSRQKRLFNYTKEAEEILHSLQSVTVNQVIELLGPILAKATLIQILQYRQEILDFVGEHLTDSKEAIESLLPFNFNVFEMIFNRGDYDGICLELSVVEFEVVKFYSLFKKVVFAYESDVKRPFKDLYTPAVSTGTSNQASSSMKQVGFRSGQYRGTSVLKATSKFGIAGPVASTKSDLIQFVTRLLLEPDVAFSNSSCMTSLVVRLFADSTQFQYESSTSVGDRLHLDPDDQDIEEPSDRKKTQATMSMAQLPPPTGKEFIFRVPSIARPAPYSRPSSHRLYCLVSPKNDFRIASAFTEDTAYF